MYYVIFLFSDAEKLPVFHYTHLGPVWIYAEYSQFR